MQIVVVTSNATTTGSCVLDAPAATPMGAVTLETSWTVSSGRTINMSGARAGVIGITGRNPPVRGSILGIDTDLRHHLQMARNPHRAANCLTQEFRQDPLVDQLLNKSKSMRALRCRTVWLLPLCVLYIISMYCQLEVVFPNGSYCGLEGGSLVGWVGVTQDLTNKHELFEIRYVGLYILIVPWIKYKQGFVGVCLPLWIPIVMLLIGPMILTKMRSRRGQCTECGYDLAKINATK